MGIWPDFTWTSVLSNRPFQPSGAMYMSRPASIACGQLTVLQPGIWL